MVIVLSSSSNVMPSTLNPAFSIRVTSFGKLGLWSSESAVTTVVAFAVVVVVVVVVVVEPSLLSSSTTAGGIVDSSTSAGGSDGSLSAVVGAMAGSSTSLLSSLSQAQARLKRQVCRGRPQPGSVSYCDDIFSRW